MWRLGLRLGLKIVSPVGMWGVLEVSSIWNLRTDINSPGCLTTLGHFMSLFNSFTADVIRPLQRLTD